MIVERKYWLRRKREELAQASIATCVEARLIHADLAKRYSIKAASVDKISPAIASEEVTPFGSAPEPLCVD
jgi:hypothetical protein